MLVKNWMTKKVIVLKPEETLAGAIEKFVKNKISGAPVVKGKKVIGILTERDIVEGIDISRKINLDTENMFSLLLATIRSRDEFEEIRNCIVSQKNVLVKDLMKKDVATISPEATLYKAIKIMNRKRVNRLPVVKNNRIVGIITRWDIIRALGKKE